MRHVAGETEVKKPEVKGMPGALEGGGTSRRQFFNRVLAGVGGVIGVGAAVPLAGFGILPALEEEEKMPGLLQIPRNPLGPPGFQYVLPVLSFDQGDPHPLR
jgi:hypothetical protein